MGRRDSNDIDWKNVKRIVSERDRGYCRLIRALTVQEMIILRRNAGHFINIIDPAHYWSVSERPELIYNPNNIVSLNRYSHSNLDDMKSPIDGHCISKEEADAWWERILKTDESQYDFLVRKELMKGD